MNATLVGGAVRDIIFGKKSPHDLDYVVVGSTPQEMLELGFTQVGTDFPVFLHPDTKEEYALARTERKSGIGHKGFQVEFSPDVTLEDDLRRRDFTMNAMAMTADGIIIDPFGGQIDIKNRVIRHTSDAFAEDPLRVLRGARFAAQLDFEVHPDTLALMRSLKSELAHLTPERVWKELEKALKSPAPHRFFEVLHDAGLGDMFFDSDEAFTHAVQDLKRFEAFDARVIALRNANLSMMKSRDLKKLVQRAVLLLNNLDADSVDLFQMLDFQRNPLPVLFDIAPAEIGEKLRRHFELFQNSRPDVTGLNTSEIPQFIKQYRRNLISNA